MLIHKGKAPDFRLPRFDGGESHFYDEARDSVLIFYKFSCPVCQFALPYLQRIYDAYGDAFYFVAIAQDGPDKTAVFRKEYGITIPTLMDLPPYSVSNKYGVESVPSIIFADASREIRASFDGFVKQEILNLADALAERSSRPQLDLFANEAVPELRPG
jgi:peroxiredoxin